MACSGVNFTCVFTRETDILVCQSHYYCVLWKRNKSASYVLGCRDRTHYRTGLLLWLRVCYVWDITAASNPGWDILCPVKKPRLLFPSDAIYGLNFVGRHWVMCDCTCRLTWCIFFTWSYVNPQICSLCAANLLLLRCWVMLKHTVVVKI